MQYFVIGPDGQKFGPADINTLTQWAAEGRLTPATMLEDEFGKQMPASELPGVFPPGLPPPRTTECRARVLAQGRTAAARSEPTISRRAEA